jgi:hypothetical protein
MHKHNYSQIKVATLLAHSENETGNSTGTKGRLINH